MGDILSGADEGIAVLADFALKAGETALIAEFPWLGFPIVKQIWEFLVGQLEAKIVVELQNGAAVIIIKANVEAQKSAADAAASALAKAQEGVDDAVHQKTLDDFQKTYADLIRTRISTPV